MSLLFQAMILQSGNDAANALARAAGGVQVTVEAMNETAEAIGAFDTVAGTPSGLDVAGQSSSPYDLALIFRALVADPVDRRGARHAHRPDAPGRGPLPRLPDPEPDPLLTTYPGGLGGKTGFTDAARHTFVTAAERDGRRLVVSVMDTENTPLRAATRRPSCSTGASPSRPAPPASARSSPQRGPGVTLTGRVDPGAPSATGGGRDDGTPAAGFPAVPVALAGTALLIIAPRWSVDGARSEAGRQLPGVRRADQRHRLHPSEGRRPRGGGEAEAARRFYPDEKTHGPTERQRRHTAGDQVR